jgi:hypothetical protein
MTDKPFVLPEGWGDDPLSQFQITAFGNELATFANAPQWQQMLRDVARVLNKCSSYAIKLVLKVEEPSAILLFLTAHNQYLASVRSVSAGHCLAAYPTGRASVESALYSWYLSTETEAAHRWNNKPNDKNALRKWGQEFKFQSLTKVLYQIDNGLAEWAKYLHQTSIDYGAHPNKDALYSNMEFEQDGDGAETIKILYLHPWNTFSIATAKFVIETGMIGIRFFALSFPDGEQTLSLTQDINKLAANLSYLQNNCILE